VSEHAPSIGIDLGTTNASMAWYDPRSGSAETILNAEGQINHLPWGISARTRPWSANRSRACSKTSRWTGRGVKRSRRTIKSIKRNLLPPPRIALILLGKPGLALRYRSSIRQAARSAGLIGILMNGDKEWISESAR
jgi:hypothetical protein